MERLLNFKKDIFINGPYPEDGSKERIDDLINDYDKITNMFTNKKQKERNEEEQFSNEELADLVLTI